MSKGPGRIQQEILKAFAANPSAVFSAQEIVELGFPGAQHEAKHRIAALRAARTLAEDSAHFDVYVGTPRAGSLIICNCFNRRSLSIGMVFESFAGTRTIDECTVILDDSGTDAHRQAQPGGLFDLHVRRNIAWATSRDDEFEAVTALIRAQLNKPSARQQMR